MPTDGAALLRALDLRDEEHREFAACLNHLLAETFLLRRFDTERYAFARRHQEALAAVLNLADWELIHDPAGQFYQALNRSESNRRPLKRLESELVLILCLSYLEQRATLRLADTPSLTMADLRQKYLGLLGETGRLTATNLREALRTLRRYRLIEPVGGGPPTPQNPDQTLLLLPTLPRLLDADQVEALHARLEKYRHTPESTDEEEGE